MRFSEFDLPDPINEYIARCSRLFTGRRWVPLLSSQIKNEGYNKNINIKEYIFKHQIPFALFIRISLCLLLQCLTLSLFWMNRLSQYSHFISLRPKWTPLTCLLRWVPKYLWQNGHGPKSWSVVPENYKKDVSMPVLHLWRWNLILVHFKLGSPFEFKCSNARQWTRIISSRPKDHWWTIENLTALKRVINKD